MKGIAVLLMLCSLAAVGMAERKHYCGRRLERKLLDLCGGIYNKRSGTMDLELSDVGGVEELQEPSLDWIISQSAVKSEGVVGERQRRGIVQECCQRGCTDWELSFYCKGR